MAELPQLPFETIIDILSRLPVKPLLRFKSVNKTWLSLISSNPAFAKAQLEHAKQNASVCPYRLLLGTCPFKSIDQEAFCVVGNDDIDSVSRELDYAPRSDFDFVGSCDGLICLVYDDNPQIIVWNPTTGASRELPKHSSFHDGKLFYGFGYDPYHDDYKIVRGAVSTYSSETKMEVFDLKGNAWRNIQGLHCSVKLSDSGTFSNGALHWLVNQIDAENYESCIVSFDLAEEKFQDLVPLPNHVHQCASKLTVIRDCLCLSPTTTYELNYFEAWTIKRNGSDVSWTKFVSFDTDYYYHCDLFIPHKYWSVLLWISKNGNVLFDLDGCDLVLFNSTEEKSTRCRVPNQWDWFKPINYVESLVSPNSILEGESR